MPAEAPTQPPRIAILTEPLREKIRALFPRYPSKRAATLPAARSICAMSHPPKMSPAGLVSAGMAMVRITGGPQAAAVSVGVLGIGRICREGG